MPLAPGPENVGQPEDRRRTELATVLASDIFKRSPQLSRLLLYLCEKCFKGSAGEITEYGIGLDVLGRDPGFDPQQDALVRVNAHHLRKRLKEYYATTGRDHEIQIVLPSGCYAPQFVPQPESVPSEEEDRMGAEAPSGKPPAAMEPETPEGHHAKTGVDGRSAGAVVPGGLVVPGGRSRKNRAAGSSGRSRPPPCCERGGHGDPDRGW